MAVKPVIVIAGLGNGSGTGGATARKFAKAGWTVALISRDRGDGSLEKLAQNITEAGGEATSFPVNDYDAASFESAFKSVKSRYASSSGYSLRAALFNAGYGVWKPFLDITPEEIETTVKIEILAAWHFAHEAISVFKDNEKLEELGGKKGTLIFTGATASIRGNVTTSAFSTGKHGARALSQSLAKEFGKQGIHVVHAIIDGSIKTGQRLDRLPPDERNAVVGLEPEHIAEVYYGVVQQNFSASTWELDLRPLNEKW